jgi:hypothetical protein
MKGNQKRVLKWKRERLRERERLRGDKMEKGTAEKN